MFDGADLEAQIDAQPPLTKPQAPDEGGPILRDRSAHQSSPARQCVRIALHRFERSRTIDEKADANDARLGLADVEREAERAVQVALVTKATEERAGLDTADIGARTKLIEGVDRGRVRGLVKRDGLIRGRRLSASDAETFLE
jgi:hypothetical protein